jgi:hypothetical protein
VWEQLEIRLRVAGKASAEFSGHWVLTKKRNRKFTTGTLICNYGMIKLMQRSGMRREAIREKQELVGRCLVNTVSFLGRTSFFLSAIGSAKESLAKARVGDNRSKSKP